MPRASFVALLASLLLPAAAAAQPLLTAAELSARLAEPKLRVVDIRAGSDAGKTPYEIGHIAGALPAPYPKWRGPKENPGKLPTTEELTSLVQRLGIDAATPVVIVYEGASSTDFGAAARVYWTLKAAGVPKLSILNGGMKAWHAAGLPVTTTVAAVVAPSTFVVTLDRSLIATRNEVAQIAGSDAVLLLDARPAEYFDGETRHVAAKTPGTIPGATNVDNAVFFGKGSGALLPAADLRRIADRHGLRADSPTVSFCNTGHWAATNWFVLSEIVGQKGARLYPESIVEWSHAGQAMDHVPGRWMQAWLQLKEAAGRL